MIIAAIIIAAIAAAATIAAATYQDASTTAEIEEARRNCDAAFAHWMDVVGTPAHDAAYLEYKNAERNLRAAINR